MSDPREFDCRVCGVHVFSYGAPHANEQDMCAECLWLLNIEDPVEREKMRVALPPRPPRPA